VGAGELAMEAGFVAVHQFKEVGLVAQCAEGESGACGFGFGFVHVRLFADFMAHAGAFELPEAHLTPTAQDHGFHVGELDLVARLQTLVEGVGEGGKTIGGLALENYGFGQQAVVDSVT